MSNFKCNLNIQKNYSKINITWSCNKFILGTNQSFVDLRTLH